MLLLGQYSGNHVGNFGWRGAGALLREDLRHVAKAEAARSAKRLEAPPRCKIKHVLCLMGDEAS